MPNLWSNDLFEYFNSVDLCSQLTDSISDYMDSIDEVIAFYSSNLNVESIYEYGSRNSEFYSDIDLIVVVKNDSQLDLSALNNISKSSRLMRILGGGTIMIFPESLFVLINWLDEVSLSKIWGKSYEIEDVGCEYTRELSCARVMDWLPERLLYFRRVVHSRMDIIYMIGLLYSIRYSFIILNKLGILPEQSLHEYSSRVDKIRSYSIDDRKDSGFRDDVFSMVMFAMYKGQESLFLLEKYMVENDLVSCVGQTLHSDVKIDLYADVGFCRSSEYNFSLTLDDSTASMYIPVPDVMLSQWQFYAEYDGYIGCKLRENIKGWNQYLKIKSNKYHYVLNKRAKIINSHSHFLRDHSISKGLFRMGWYC